MAAPRSGRIADLRRRAAALPLDAGQGVPLLSPCLTETVETRQKNLAGQGGSHTREAEALQRLTALAEQAASGRSSRLDALVAHLGEIGVGKDSDTRVVLVSERLATLDRLREALPGALGMPTGAFAVLHGQLPDSHHRGRLRRGGARDAANLPPP